MPGPAFDRISRLVLALWFFAGSLAAEPALVHVPSLGVSPPGSAPPNYDVLDATMLPPDAAPAPPTFSDETLRLASLDLPEGTLPRTQPRLLPPEAVEPASAVPPSEFVTSSDEPLPPGVEPGVALSPGDKWIDVNLSRQRIVAYVGGEAVRMALISSGVAAHPTVVGQFHVYLKLYAQRMKGGSPETHDDYDLPGVPDVMYFFADYALHGAYWHHNFGHPMSHGCVNLPLDDAQWFYEWTPIGTPVLVHG